MEYERMCRVLLDQLEQCIQVLCIAQERTEELYLSAPQPVPVPETEPKQKQEPRLHKE